MTDQDSKTYLYDAFISYRHVEPDKTIAEKLHRLLETYKVPANTAKKTGFKKIRRVFRDRDELPTSSDLAENICNALSKSRYLIVICSPSTSKSEWVLKEIDTFIQMHGHDKVLALLVKGEPAEAFPEQLRLIPYTEIVDGVVTNKGFKNVEPLAADIRGNDIKEMQKSLRIEKLRLIAPILGCSFDDLRQRHRERFIRKVITISVALSVFFLGFGAFSTWQAIKIKSQVNKTLKGQSLYLSDISGKLLGQGDRKMAMLLALEALPKNMSDHERPYVEEAEFALSESLAAYKFDSSYTGDMALEHKQGVADIVLNPKGTAALTSCKDGYYYLWKTGNGSKILSIKNGLSYPTSGNVFFSKDGKRITGLARDGISSWDAKTGKKLWSVKTTVNHLLLSPDYKTVAAGGSELSFYDNETGNKLSEISIPVKESGSAVKMQFNKDGSLLAVGTTAGYAVIVDVKANSVIHSYKTDYEYVDNLAFSRDGKRLSVVSNFYDMKDPFAKGKGSLSVIDCSSGNIITAIKNANSSIKLSRFGSVDSDILIYTERELVRVYNISKKSIVYTFVHGGTVTSLFMNDIGSLLVTSSMDGNIRFFSMSMGIEYDWEIIKNTDEIEKMETAPNGILAVSARSSNRAYIYKMISGPHITRIPGHSDLIGGGEFSPDGLKSVTFGIGNNEVCVSDTKKNKFLGKLKGIEGTIEDARFIQNGKYILTLTKEGNVSLWDSISFKKVKENEIGRISRYVFSADNSRLAVIVDEGCKVYNLKDLKEVMFSKDYMALGSLCLSQDGKKLIIMGGFADSAIYETGSGKELKRFKDLRLRFGAFSNDGDYLFTASDSIVYIFGLKEKKIVKKIQDIKTNITSISVDYEGNCLLVGLQDKTVRVYDSRTGSFRQELSGNASVVKRILFRDKGKTMVTIGDLKDTVIWNYDNYKKLAYINRAFDIDESMTRILSSDDKALIIMPKYKTEMLVDEAKKQLGSRTLTEKDKADYFIVD